MPLSPEHQKFLTDAGIIDLVRNARGYDTVTDPKRLTSFEFAAAQCRVPTLLLPVHDLTGTVILRQIRPDNPRLYNGRPAKYELPYKSKSALDVPLGSRGRLQGNDPVWIVDGILQADAAVSRGLCAVAVLGVEHTRAAEQSLRKMKWRDRIVYLAFGRRNVEAEAHVQHLARFLRDRGAKVTVLNLVDATGNPAGLHRLFASGRTPEDVRQACKVNADETEEEPVVIENEYRRRDDGLFRVGREKGKLKLYRLSNFTVEILSEVIRDDGTEQTRAMRLQSSFRGITSTFTISAEDFSLAKWIDRECGAGAVVEAGYGNRDHFLAAVRSLSKNVRRELVITHTGWRLFPEGWGFVHAGGIILPQSPLPNLSPSQVPNDNCGTEVSGSTQSGGIARHSTSNDSDPISAHACRVDLGEWHRFHLPSHEDDADDLIGKALDDLIELGPDYIILPMLATAYRAAIGGADFGVMLTAKTGVKKTTIASLFMQFFGQDLDRDNIPLNWNSTPNSLVANLYLLKDVLALIDDYRPDEAYGSRAKANRDADQVLRSHSNKAGRHRCYPDGTPRPAKHSRSLPVTTSESFPSGESLLARNLVILMSPLAYASERNEALLSRVQQYANEGLYAKSIHLFIQRMANDYEGHRGEFRLLTEQYLPQTRYYRYATEAIDSEAELKYDDLTMECRRRRTRRIVAELCAAMELAVSLYLEPAEWEKLKARLWKALAVCVTETNAQVAANEPETLVLELLRTAFQSRLAHVCSPEGGRPQEDARVWGWDKVVVPAPAREAPPSSPPTPATGGQSEEESASATHDKWVPRGRPIGWTDGYRLHLDAYAAVTVLNTIGRGSNCGLTLTTAMFDQALVRPRRYHTREQPTESSRGEIHAESRYREVVQVTCEEVFSSTPMWGPVRDETPSDEDRSEQHEAKPIPTPDETPAIPMPPQTWKQQQALMKLFEV